MSVDDMLDMDKEKFDTWMTAFQVWREQSGS
jgi:hypothetical protein